VGAGKPPAANKARPLGVSVRGASRAVECGDQLPGPVNPALAVRPIRCTVARAIDR